MQCNWNEQGVVSHHVGNGNWTEVFCNSNGFMIFIEKSTVANVNLIHAYKYVVTVSVKVCIDTEIVNKYLKVNINLNINF